MGLRFALLLSAAWLLSPPLAAEPALRVASWNLGQGERLEAVLAGLESAKLFEDCDILALQETQTAAGDDLAETVAARRGWHWFGNASNAIVSRSPILRSGYAAIGVRRTRELPWAEVDSPLGPVRLYSVHLTFRDGGGPFEEELRFQELAWTLYHLEKTAPPADPDLPVILAGDFNTVGRLLWGHQNEKGLRLLTARGFLAGPGDGATHPIFGRLDWIFARGLRPADGGVGRLSGSDHRWLWARFEFVGPKPAEPGRVRGTSLLWPIALALGAAGLVSVGFRRRRRQKSVDR